MGYVEYWNLKEKPFEEVRNTRFYYESDDHREALDRMLYVVNDKSMNIGLLTGEIGSGKTITKNVFKGQLPSHDFAVVDFENSHYRYIDILYSIVTQISFRDSRTQLDDSLAIPARDDKYLLIAVFKKMLEILVYEEKRHLVIIFDEAQQMDPSVLDEVTNISSETEAYMTIFLVGQPELREKVKKAQQVDQRVFLRFHLNNLDFNNTLKYVQHRLRIAGAERSNVFTHDAIETIYRATNGIPREINRLCKLVLTFGFAQNLLEIDKTHVAAIVEDLRRHR